jgi:EAL domain-containing protein (putative c-di-GMP-specific phosphodiesterase class I)
MQNLDVVDVLRKPFRPAQLRDLLSGLAAHPMRGPELIPAPPGSTATLDEIRHALAKGEFALHFQPQLRVGDRAWVGVEALVRWSHPTLGLLRPEAFIPQVEVSDLALPFTYAIMAQALDALAAIERDTGFSGRLSVNVPPAALTIADFPDRVLRLLTAAGVDSSRLTIEITETSIAVDPTLSLDIQTRLRMHGVRLSIDDFGTGHSSLERLHEAPFDEMKIDMVLVRNADRDPSLRKIAEGAIALGRSLAMTVVAEGVEAEETLVWLARVGCDLAQGYGIGRPMGGAELRRWAAAHRAAASGHADGIDLAPARRVSTN